MGRFRAPQAGCSQRGRCGSLAQGLAHPSFRAIIILQDMLVEGVDVEYQGREPIWYDKVQSMDFEDPGNNYGLAVIAIKNPADANTAIWVGLN
ncbi:MAG: hypothetical protein ACLP5H_34495 [Desulfomonilaceae bacterium]